MAKEKSFENLDPSFNYTGDKGPRFGVRHVQILITAIGTSIAFATKSIFSVTLVAMTDNTTSTNPNVQTYDWDNKSVIISAVLWTGFLANLLAGYFGKIYGPKWFMVGASTFNSIFFMLIPLSAQFGGSTGVIICRLGQGLALGFYQPLNAVIMGRWAPPEERSRLNFMGGGLMTISLIGSSIVTGFIAQSYWGWPWIYYIFGTFGLTWTVCYVFVAKQSADDHKSISPEEKKYLETTLFKIEKDEVTPWKQIISSLPVWAVIIAGTGFTWSTVIMSTEMAIFLSKAMEFDVQTNGIISALPSLVGLIFGIAFAFISDLIPKKGILSIVNTRRIFHLGGAIGISVPLILMTFISVEHRKYSVLLICVSGIFSMGAAVGGSNVNLLDISPKFAGIITGLSQTLAEIISIFAPLTVHWVCTDETDRMQWVIVFGISATITIPTAIFFVIFASDKRQSWETESDREAELEIQKRKSSVINFAPGVTF